MPEPLRRMGKDGTPYTRPPEIEAWIKKLEDVEPMVRIRQFDGISRRRPEYVPTEVLVYFLRRAWAAGDHANFEKNFRILLSRVEKSLNSAISEARMDGAAEIRDEVRGRFLELITKDCNERPDLMDFFEIRFDKAMVAIRTSVLRKMGPSTIKTVPLSRTGDDDDSEISEEVETAATEFLGGDPSKLDDPAFRSTLAAAIDGLPADQKRVICLILEGFPIDSKEHGVMTIAQILQCDERTVRNRRDRACKALKAILHEENAQ